jgi:hypothetical protein
VTTSAITTSQRPIGFTNEDKARDNIADSLDTIAGFAEFLGVCKASKMEPPILDETTLFNANQTPEFDVCKVSSNSLSRGRVTNHP